MSKTPEYLADGGAAMIASESSIMEIKLMPRLKVMFILGPPWWSDGWQVPRFPQ
jgi:hypothetical protein